MVQYKLAFDVVYDNIVYKSLDKLLSTIPFSTYFDVLCNKN
jgi:hypothetical protein